MSRNRVVTRFEFCLGEVAALNVAKLCLTLISYKIRIIPASCTHTYIRTYTQSRRFFCDLFIFLFASQHFISSTMGVVRLSLRPTLLNKKLLPVLLSRCGGGFSQRPNLMYSELFQYVNIHVPIRNFIILR